MNRFGARRELVWDRFRTELPVNWTEDRPQAWEVNRSWTEQDRTEPYETLTQALRRLHQETVSFFFEAPAHLSTEDDVYKGYHIPAGTMVLANTWAMSFDSDRYEDPSAFRPERWLSEKEMEKARGLRAKDYAFGYGRRVCPGQPWAEQLIFIAVASILAAFNIEAAVGEDGKLIPPNEDYLPSFVRSLGASKCNITPRSQKMVSLIEGAAEAI
ncbi:cytochrome P450 [Schizopora paradoxa]|uniref:Cytochrome P450 n=1 Tax=Schizopora paradoxa TaxID=27342 RepID=A0A0H2R375_9AGAM|nr:cytochrome P450 [Schizopora paradoxa]